MLQTRPARLCLDPPQEQGGLGEQLKMSTWRTSQNKDIENSSNKDLEKSSNEDIEDMFVDSKIDFIWRNNEKRKNISITVQLVQCQRLLPHTEVFIVG